MLRALPTLMVLLLMGAIAPTANAEVVSLDGRLEIVFDPANEGREGRWFEDDVFTGLDARRAIAVPGAWELIEEDYEDVAFYRKAFEVPADWKGQVVRLQFGAVNYICEVWLNGEAVGAHEGGFTPFEYRVEHSLFAGLPADGAMREIYENVWAPQTLRNLGGETIVATVGFQWFSHDHKLHHRGPGESWWGADLGVIPVGSGLRLSPFASGDSARLRGN
jgi:hypothetical protein